MRFYTEQTFVQYSRTLRGLGEAHGLDLGESARLMGYVNVATADTMIACWEAKYHYMFWRPNHAIRGPTRTGTRPPRPDPAWRPLVIGNHPEYPSGHGCFTGAVTESLRSYFGTKHVRIVASAGPWVPARRGRTRTRRAGRGRRERTRLGRPPLPLDDAGGRQGAPRIARDVGKHYFLEHAKNKDD